MVPRTNERRAVLAIDFIWQEILFCSRRVIISRSNNGGITVDLNVVMKDGVNMIEIVKLVKLAFVKEYKYKVVFWLTSTLLPVRDCRTQYTQNSFHQYIYFFACSVAPFVCSQKIKKEIFY